MSIIEAFQQSKWQLQFGDATVLGWVTTGLYAVAFLFSTLILMRSFYKKPSSPQEILFWGFMSLCMLGLGLNKQLDLQTLVTDMFRIIAREEGWYEERREFQKAFIIGVAIFAGIVFLFLLALIQKHFISRGVTLLGVCFLLAFIVIRGASFHHADSWFRESVGEFKMHQVLELVGIGVTILGSLISLMINRSHEAPPSYYEGKTLQ